MFTRENNVLIQGVYTVLLLLLRRPSGLELFWKLNIVRCLKMFP